jgi:hypothetical protein
MWRYSLAMGDSSSMSRAEISKTALTQLLYYQLVVLLTFWLIMVAPSMCQYHGLLSLRAHPTDIHTHHQPFNLATSHHNLFTHTTAPGDTLLLSLLVLVLPAAIPMGAHQVINAFTAESAFRPRQHTLPPPDEPPR